MKTAILKILQYSQETPVLESLFNKVAGIRACSLIKKETPTQVFSCEYCEILKNICKRLPLNLSHFFAKLHFYTS